MKMVEPIKRDFNQKLTDSAEGKVNNRLMEKLPQRCNSMFVERKK